MLIIVISKLFQSSQNSINFQECRSLTNICSKCYKRKVFILISGFQMYYIFCITVSLGYYDNFIHCWTVNCSDAELKTKSIHGLFESFIEASSTYYQKEDIRLNAHSVWPSPYLYCHIDPFTIISLSLSGFESNGM